MEITGQILKENRKKLSLTLSEVSAATKISVKILEALEAGQRDQLPSLTFLRGFVRSYAKYLKLDEESIMQTFYEEMGTSTSQKVRQPKEGNEEEQAERHLRPHSFKSKFFAVTGIIVLIILIIFVRNMVHKYEKEAMLPPLADIQQMVQQQSEKSLPNQVPHVSPDPSNQPITEPGIEAESAQSLKEEEKAETDKLVENDSSQKQEIITQPLANANMQESKPIQEIKKQIVETTQASPQEIIIEALDNTSLSFKIDSANKVNISLKASEMHVIKANTKITLDLADGGAVNLIYNGKRRGVPGDLGKAIKLSFP